MQVYLYKTTSDTRQVTKDLTGTLNFEGDLRNEVEFLDPVILIETNLDVSQYNYAYIPTFNRYYYIKFKGVRKDLVEFTGHVDVLMSNNIRSLTGIVRRNSQAWNLYLNDPRLQQLAYNRIQTKRFPNNPLKIDNDNFFLVTIGRSDGI